MSPIEGTEDLTQAPNIINGSDHSCNAESLAVKHSSMDTISPHRTGLMNIPLEIREEIYTIVVMPEYDAPGLFCGNKILYAKRLWHWIEVPSAVYTCRQMRIELTNHYVQQCVVHTKLFDFLVDLTPQHNIPRLAFSMVTNLCLDYRLRPTYDLSQPDGLGKDLTKGWADPVPDPEEHLPNLHRIIISIDAYVFYKPQITLATARKIDHCCEKAVSKILELTRGVKRVGIVTRGSRDSDTPGHLSFGHGDSMISYATQSNPENPVREGAVAEWFFQRLIRCAADDDPRSFEKFEHFWDLCNKDSKTIEDEFQAYLHSV